MKTKMNKTRFKSPKPKSFIILGADEPSDIDKFPPFESLFPDVMAKISWKKRISEVKNKGQAQAVGIDFQQWASEQDLSYGELAHYQNELHKMAKKFGLVKEFKENAVI